VIEEADAQYEVEAAEPFNPGVFDVADAELDIWIPPPGLFNVVNAAVETHRPEMQVPQEA
jgi:hypothetical protein